MMEMNLGTTSQTWKCGQRVGGDSNFSFSGNSSALCFDDPRKAEKVWVWMGPAGYPNPMALSFPSSPAVGQPQTESPFHLEGGPLGAAIKWSEGWGLEPAAAPLSPGSIGDTGLQGGQVSVSRGAGRSPETPRIQLSHTEATEEALASVMTPLHRRLADFGPAPQSPHWAGSHSKLGLNLISRHLRSSPEDPQNARGGDICKALAFPYKQMEAGSPGGIWY